MFNTYKHFDSLVDLHASLTNEQMNCYLARSRTYAPRFTWSTQLDPIFRNCLVHMSPHVPGKVAYFASIENMMTNTTTRTSPEMFLERFLSTAPKDLQTAWKVEVLGHVLPTLKFIENDNEAGWIHVYNHGPHSCMAGSRRCRGYAHPKNNLALAYVEDNCKIEFRTIVNKKKMTYVRIYSRDKQDTSFMSTALSKAGFTKDEETLEGELIYVYYEDCDHCGQTFAVGPYFDGCCSEVALLPGNPNEGIIGDEGIQLQYEEDVSSECECDRNDDEYDNEDDDHE